MESVSKKGKIFTGKFASLAVKLGLATPSGEGEKVKRTRRSNKPK
jgi:hypothetical protein